MGYSSGKNSSNLKTPPTRKQKTDFAQTTSNGRTPIDLSKSSRKKLIDFTYCYTFMKFMIQQLLQNGLSQYEPKFGQKNIIEKHWC